MRAIKTITLRDMLRTAGTWTGSEEYTQGQADLICDLFGLSGECYAIVKSAITHRIPVAQAMSELLAVTS
jgi:hypothetical protein